jgi:hypothetical protein
MMLMVGTTWGCSQIAVWLLVSCKNCILNDKSNQDSSEIAWMEAVVEVGAQQSREAQQRILKRNR